MNESANGVSHQPVRHSPRLDPKLRSNCAEARIGDEYQANLDWAVYSPHEADRDQCVWRPSAAVNPDHLRNFLEWIKTERDIAEDEALYILHQSDYSIEKAMERLQQLVQRKISPKTMRIFKNGFQQCRRRFSINQMKLVLPHLSSRRLVDLYCLAKGGDVRLLYNVNDFHWSSSKKYDLNGSKFVEQIGKLSVAIQKQIAVRKKSVIAEEIATFGHRPQSVTNRRSIRLRSLDPINYSDTTRHRRADVSGLKDENVQSSTSVPEAEGGSKRINLKELLFMVYDMVDDYVVDVSDLSTIATTNKV